VKLKQRKPSWGQRHRHQTPPKFHCEVCASVIRQYNVFVMRWNPTTQTLHTPSGLDINVHHRESK